MPLSRTEQRCSAITTGAAGHGESGTGESGVQFDFSCGPRARRARNDGRWHRCQSTRSPKRARPEWRVSFSTRQERTSMQRRGMDVDVERGPRTQEGNCTGSGSYCLRLFEFAGEPRFRAGSPRSARYQNILKIVCAQNNKRKEQGVECSLPKQLMVSSLRCGWRVESQSQCLISKSTPSIPTDRPSVLRGV